MTIYNELGKNISILHRHAQKYFAIHLAELKIGSGDYGPLIYLCENPGLSQEAIAARFAMTKGTIAKMLYRFEAQGLIKKRQNPADKRANCIHPTAKAKTYYPKLLAIRAGWNTILLECLTDIEGNAFDQLLRKSANHVLTRPETKDNE